MSDENNDDWAAALEESAGDDDWAAAMTEQGDDAETGGDDDWGSALEEQATADADAEDGLTEDETLSIIDVRFSA